MSPHLRSLVPTVVIAAVSLTLPPASSQAQQLEKTAFSLEWQGVCILSSHV